MPVRVSPFSPADESALMRELWSPRIAEDLNAFVRFVFPWGKPNTPLAHYKGPRKWQEQDLDEISQSIKDNKGRLLLSELPLLFRKSTVSGRGPGKSAEVSWLTYWMMSVNLGSTTIITANTEAQLKSRTWAEVGKWHTLAINGHWFERGAMQMKPAPWFEDRLKKDLGVDTGYYYAQAQLWSEETPDAFAGVHNPNGVFVIFDEASGIPKPIWTVTEGFFTEPVLHRYWMNFSNGRRNSGAFFDCFHKDRGRWRLRNLDSRTVEGVDVSVLQNIIDTYGADSDEARVEVYGQFPKQGDMQFISRELVNNAIHRELPAEDIHAPLMMGVDVARYGNDSSVIRFRQGRDARSIPAQRFKGLDNMQLAYKCAECIEKYNPDAVCIDAGNGTGVIDRLRDLGYKVFEVWFGSKANSDEWADKSTEMWAEIRNWLGGGCLPNDQELLDDLTVREYRFRGKSDRVSLETKEELRKRGFASPDDGDALALTFAVKVARKDRHASRAAQRSVVARDVDYDLFA